MDVTKEVKRRIWESAAEYHEAFVRSCVGMAKLDRNEAEVAGMAIEVHAAIATYARLELAKLQPPMQGAKVKP